MHCWLFWLFLFSTPLQILALNSTCIEFKGTYYNLLENFESEDLFLTWKLLELFNIAFITRCVISCYSKSSQCQGVAYKGDMCYTLTSGYTSAGDYWMNDGTWAVYTRQGATMDLPVYRLSEKTGIEFRETWRSGENTPKSNVNIKLDPLSTIQQFYRHAYVDNWRHWGVQKVKVGFYRKRVEDAFVTLTLSKASTIENFFKINRLDASSWSDLYKGQETDFRTYAQTTDRPDFIYIRGEWNNCGVLAYWMLAQRSHSNCQVFPEYPQFLYAKGGKKQKALSSNVGHSTDLVITVQIPL